MNKLDFTVLFSLILVAGLFWYGIFWLTLDKPEQTEQQALEYYDVLNSFTFASSSVDVNVEGLTI